MNLKRKFAYFDPEGPIDNALSMWPSGSKYANHYVAMCVLYAPIALVLNTFLGSPSPHFNTLDRN